MFNLLRLFLPSTITWTINNLDSLSFVSDLHRSCVLDCTQVIANFNREEKVDTGHFSNDFWILNMIFPSSEKLLQIQMYHHFFMYQLFIAHKKSEICWAGEDEHVARHNNNVRDSDELPDEHVARHANRILGVGVRRIENVWTVYGGVEYDIQNCMKLTMRGWSTFEIFPYPEETWAPHPLICDGIHGRDFSRRAQETLGTCLCLCSSHT
jgi:hypothetical protein